MGAETLSLLSRRKGLMFVSLSLFILIVWLHLSYRLRSNGSFQSVTEYQSKSAHSSLSQHCEADCQAYTKRLHRYCHTSLLNGREHLSSHENSLQSNKDQYELVHVHIVARHGDRTPVSKFKIGQKPFYECGLTNGSFNWQGLRDFPLPVPLPASSEVDNSHLSVNPVAQSKECGDVKGIGKLTTLGYLQHASLGKLMREQYNSFVSEIINNVNSLQRNVFVQSTDFSRTIRSASAFMLGFLPDSTKLRQATTIHISEGSLLESPPIGINVVYQPCHDYHQIWNDDRRQTDFFKNENKRHYLLSNLCSMFSLQPKCRYPIVSKVFEHVMIRGCHYPSDMLPCSKATGTCVDYLQARELFSFVDWVWSTAHPLKSSIIALSPFLNHSLLTPMERMVVSYTYGRNNRLPGLYKVMLSLTHDDTIVKLLTSLGVSVREWIPYASRVVFELWKKKGGSSPKDFMVRILFNGKTVTESTGAWRKGMHPELVPFVTLREFLTSGKYRDLQSYNEICHIH